MDGVDTTRRDELVFRALATWSGIAEPGETWAGTLVEAMGPVGALHWAKSPFSIPHLDHDVVPPPEGQGGLFGRSGIDDGRPEAHQLRRGWKRIHERLQPRLSEFNLSTELSSWERLGGHIVLPGEAGWPGGFARLGAAAPFALWVRGTLPSPTRPRVAIVGARASTNYGNSVASDLSFELVEAGCAVISGGAYGIDSAAHRAALRASTTGCATSAVLCGGLEHLYPVGNTALFEHILAAGGSLVAEMPPSFRPARWRFLERNRLIAAWSQMVVVVEASIRSGALATANRALELGVEVGCVPGPVTSAASSGTNDYLRLGAAVITCSRDILGHLGLSQPDLAGSGQETGDLQPSRLEQLTPLQRRVWDALPRDGVATANSVAAEAGQSVSEVGGALFGLKLEGLVGQAEGGAWFRAAGNRAHTRASGVL